MWTPTNPPLVLGTFPTCHANALRYSLEEDESTYSDLLQDVVALDRAGNVKGTGQFGYVEFRESLYGLPLDIQQ